LIISAKVHANSKEFKIEKKGDVLEIYVRSPPEDNKANLEIIKELTKKYGSCRIIRGAKSKKKVLEI